MDPSLLNVADVPYHVAADRVVKKVVGKAN